MENYCAYTATAGGTTATGNVMRGGVPAGLGNGGELGIAGGSDGKSKSVGIDLNDGTDAVTVVVRGRNDPPRCAVSPSCDL